MLALRYALLPLLTALGGIATGFLWLVPNGLMAGAMGFCFSLGTIWLAEKERRKPVSVGLPDVLAAGVVSGMLAIVPVMLLEMVRPAPGIHPHSDMFRPPALDNWYLIAAPLVFGIALHWSYYTGHRGKRPLRQVILTACISVSVIRVILLLIQEGPQMSHDSGGVSDWIMLVIAGLIFSAMGPAPYAAVWTLVTAKLDPAFGTTLVTTGSTPPPPSGFQTEQ